MTFTTLKGLSRLLVEHMPFSSKPIWGSWPVAIMKGTCCIEECMWVVVCKLSCWQKLIPVVLFVAREDMDKLLEFLVGAFSLAISLQVVRS
jgi:hypothetical protein